MTERSPNEFLNRIFVEDTNELPSYYERIAKTIHSTVAWAESEFDVELRAWQKQILSTSNRKVAMRIARRMGKCMHEDTPIIMANGSIKKIKDVHVGDWVTSSYKQSLCPRQVKAKHNNGVQDCYKIKTKTGREIICTKEHKLLRYVNRPIWTRVKNLSIGDKIAIAGHYPIYGNETLPDDYDPKTIPINALKLNKKSSLQLISDILFQNTYHVPSRIGYKMVFNDPITPWVVELLLGRAGIFVYRSMMGKKHSLHIKDYKSIKTAIKLFGIAAALPARNYLDKTKDVVWDTVVSILHIGTAPTYDLEIDTYTNHDRNFLANGVVVHNSFIMLIKMLHFAVTHENGAIFWVGQSEQLINEIFDTKFPDLLNYANSPLIENSIIHRLKKPVSFKFGNGTIIRTIIAGSGSSGEGLRGLGRRLSGTGRVCRAHIEKQKDKWLTIRNIEGANPLDTFTEEDVLFDHYIIDSAGARIQVESNTELKNDLMHVKLSGVPQLDSDELWFRVEINTGDTLIILDEADYLSDRALVALTPILEEDRKVEVWAATTPKDKGTTFYKWSHAPVVDKATGLNTMGFVAYHFPQWEIDPEWTIRDKYTGQPLLDEDGNILTKERDLRLKYDRKDYSREIAAEYAEDAGGAYSQHKIDLAFRGPRSNYKYTTKINMDSPIRTMGVDWNKYSSGPEFIIVEMEPITKLLYIIARYQMESAQGENDLTYTKALHFLDYLASIYLPHHIYVDKGAGEQQVESLLIWAHDSNKPYLKNVQGRNFSSSVTITNWTEKKNEPARLKSVMVDNTSRLLDYDLIVGRDDGYSASVLEEVSPDHPIQPFGKIQQRFPVSLPDQLTALKVKARDRLGYSFTTNTEDHAHDALILAIQAVFENHPDFTDRMPAAHINVATIAMTSEKDFKKFAQPAVDLSKDNDNDGFYRVQPFGKSKGHGGIARGFGSKTEGRRTW